ncbi:MAG: hypothetical protein AAB725_00275 [Patescibacteria group bacterium]|mgnify:FL=1
MIGVLILVEVIILFFLVMLFVFLGLPLLFTGAPFIPSYRRARHQILAPLFEIAKKAPGNKFVDLGSGDARVVIEFAQHGFESTGVEYNPFLVWWSRIKIKKLNIKHQNAKIIRANFWHVDLSSFDIVFIFQLNYVNALLAEKFKKELKTGALIISAGFPMFGFELIKREGIFWVYRN